MKKIVCIALVSVALASCEVTRTVTTQSQYTQNGDSSVMIQTKTTETVTGTKIANPLQY